jgi:hypothetical protein
MKHDKNNITISLTFKYPADEARLRHALHGDKAFLTLHDLHKRIEKWEDLGRVHPDDLIDNVKASITSLFHFCGEQ